MNYYVQLRKYQKGNSQRAYLYLMKQDGAAVSCMMFGDLHLKEAEKVAEWYENNGCKVEREEAKWKLLGDDKPSKRNSLFG